MDKCNFVREERCSLEKEGEGILELQLLKRTKQDADAEG
jgi:hypothetical protein